MSYKPHTALSDKARASASLRRLIGGIVVFVAVFIAILLLVSRVQWMFVPSELQPTWAQDLETASTPVSLLVNLYAFGFIIIALGVTMRLIHNRSWTSVIGTPGAAFTQFLAVGKMLLALHVAFMLLPAPEEMALTRNMALGLWLLYLPFTAVGVLIQTGAEELVFRGYLQSQLAARFKSPRVWILLPSLLFGALHFDPNVDETAAWIVVAWAACFGLVAADLTARSGTLGPAIALHLINNLMVMAVFAPEGNFDGAALFTMPFDMSDTAYLMAWMPVEFLILLCSWLAARLALRV